MFGTAIGYEARFTQAEIADIAGKYADEIDRLNGEIGAAENKAQQDALAARRDSLQEQWDNEVEEAKVGYMKQVNAIVNGMMTKHPEAKAELEKAAKDYDVYVALHDAWEKAKKSENPESVWKNFFTEDIRKEYLSDITTDNIGALAIELRDRLMESLTSSLEKAGGEDSFAYTLLQTILKDPLTSDYFDPKLTEGALDGLVEALDFKSAGEKAGDNFFEGLTPGLADALDEAQAPTVKKLDELGGELNSEATRIGAAMGAALSAGFNSNINLRTPSITGSNKNATNVNVTNNGNSAADMYKVKRALDDYRKRQMRGYGLG